jgi:hypothetical protein
MLVLIHTATDAAIRSDRHDVSAGGSCGRRSGICSIVARRFGPALAS